MGIRSAAANPAYRFVGLFALYLAVIALGYPWLTERWIAPCEAMTTATAVIEYALLSLVSDEASLSGNLVQLGPFGVRIIAECTGIFEALIFLAAVLAYPTSWAKKLDRHRPRRSDPLRLQHPAHPGADRGRPLSTTSSSISCTSISGRPR